MHRFPIMFFNIGAEPFAPEQMEYLLAFENSAEDVKGETGVPGLRIDFNSGVRVQVDKGRWHVRISDFDTGMVGFEGDISEKTLVSAEKYYIHWVVEAWKDGEKVFGHVMDLGGQKITIFMPNCMLGDTVGMLPYIRLLKDYYRAEVSLSPPKQFFQVCREYLPDIPIIDEIPEDSYAAFFLAIFDKPPYLTPSDYRCWTPDLTARAILGLHENAPKLKYYPTEDRKIMEPYVCIGVQASGIMKGWHYPNGWNIIVAYLKELGYRVICIDGSNHYEEDGYKIDIPEGAEDFTGMRPLMERINLLAYADFFVGLPSGLSWLADACDIPVVVISGFSLPIAEFDTPYRVTNPFVCHGCYNDIRVNWKGGCPYHKGSDREYECSKKLAPQQVANAINRVIADRQ